MSLHNCEILCSSITLTNENDTNNNCNDTNNNCNDNEIINIISNLIHDNKTDNKNNIHNVSLDTVNFDIRFDENEHNKTNYSIDENENASIFLLFMYYAMCNFPDICDNNGIYLFIFNLEFRKVDYR